MPRPVLTTERITLRPMTSGHLPLLHVLDSDPQVMRYLTGRARTPEEIDVFWGPKCLDRTGDDRGLGWWVGFDGDDFLGWWCLTVDDADPHAGEIGWRVRRDRWRRGLATEGAEALVEHGFDSVGLQRIWADTMAVNAGSRGVMHKLGMRHARTEHRTWDDPLPGNEHGDVVYELTAEEWRARHEPGPLPTHPSAG